MKLELMCLTTGEPCWNYQIFAAYSERVSAEESLFATSHPETVVGIGIVACDGTYSNDSGGGEMCDYYIDKPTATICDVQIDLPGSEEWPEDLTKPKFFKPHSGWLYDMSVGSYQPREKRSRRNSR